MNHDDPARPGAYRPLFEDAVAGLDHGTINRLRLMRRETLAERPVPRARRLLPVAAFAVAALALGLGWRLGGFGGNDGAGPPAGDASPAQLELSADLPSDDDTALYAWLGEAPVAAEGESL